MESAILANAREREDPNSFLMLLGISGRQELREHAIEFVRAFDVR